MFKRVLVPVDGSELSEAVFPWITYFAATLQPEPRFRIVRAFEPPSLVYLLPDLSVPTTHILSDEHLSGAILGYLEQIKSRLRLQVDTKMLIGDPASEILEMSESSDLVIMSSHGRGGIGKWLLGSVATKVARGVRVPLLVISAKVPKPAKNLSIKSILCADDGSAVSERAFEVAARLAKALGAKLHIYCGVSQVELSDTLALRTNQEGIKRASRRLAKLAESAPDGVEVTYEARETYGQTGISRYAEELGVDLICMGSHGKGGFERWMLGSETEKTLLGAKCPVLITH